ncbi:hypothetical protein ACIP1T_25980 [Pseudomonas japonica]|uniref:hypothetical protein n=1 Tax=Pseudomonas japonica TaxID=256466 RepID=UPI00380F61BD
MDHYLLRELNGVDVDVLEEELQKLEGVIVKQAVDFIKDAKQREAYILNTGQLRKELLEQLAADKITIRQAVEFCVETRNKFLLETRKRTSAVGLAFVEKEKPNPLSLEKLRDEKATKKFQMKFDDLHPLEQRIVNYEIIESSGRPRASYNTVNKRLRTLGKTFILATSVYVIYDIATSDDKGQAIAGHTGALAGGYAGGLLAGLATSAVCGPGAPVCAVALLVIGGGVGGWLGSELGEYFYSEKDRDAEVKAFYRWISDADASVIR